MCSLRTLCSWALLPRCRHLSKAICFRPQLRFRSPGHLPCVHGVWSCHLGAVAVTAECCTCISSVLPMTRTGVISKSRRWIRTVGSHMSLLVRHRRARERSTSTGPRQGRIPRQGRLFDETGRLFDETGLFDETCLFDETEGGVVSVKSGSAVAELVFSGSAVAEPVFRLHAQMRIV